MKILRYISVLLLCALALQSRAQEPEISLITCFPGPEVYELCGHTGIRVVDKDGDRVWNYGMFDFNAPNFIGRFVKGETDYYTAAIPTQQFIYPYQLQGRKVVEQKLNLTPEEKKKVMEKLNHDLRPENSVYRYNYVRDNCATRPFAAIYGATDATLKLPREGEYGSFRREMRSFHRNYPWYQFGIDLVLGSGLDREIDPEAEMFVPVVLSERIGKAVKKDGTPLVSSITELSPGKPDAILSPTPWYLTPMCWSIVMAAICLTTAIIDFRRKQLTRIVYAAWFLLQGLAGCLVGFLVFFSEHEATSPNIMIFWLNPLALVVPALIWLPSMRGVVKGYIWLELLCIAVMLAGILRGVQSVNPATWPLIAATVILSAAYAIVSPKISYNKSARKGVRKSASRRASSASRKKKR